MEQKQPKITQKMLLRTFFLLLAGAALFLGINFVLKWRKDPDMGGADTAGSIAAIEILPEGQQVVLFDSAGKKIPCPEYETGKTDRDIAWLPDGNRLYFVSDRKQNAYHLYRWNTSSNAITPMTTGTLSKFDPSFATVADPSDKASVSSASKMALITQGGFVLAFDIEEKSSQQLLPPPGNVTTGNEEGSGGSGQFDAMYQKFGNAFRSARWMMNGDYVAAIMKQDAGEVLIVQKLNAKDVNELKPMPLMAGDKIDMDVDPKTGMVVFSVLNFQFPDRDNIPEAFIQNGKAVKPFVNGVFFFNPTELGPDGQPRPTAIAVSNEMKMAFGAPAVSPDGSQLVVVTGNYDGTTFEPAGLAAMPLQANGMQAGTPLVPGSVYEPAWLPDGNTVVFIKREGKERAIYKVGKDGSAETKVSDGGNFMTPKASPQIKAAG